MLKAVQIADGRRRLYFASYDGTKNNLRKCPPEHIDAAKEILRGYLALGEAFQIRVGCVLPVMQHATLIGPEGVVFSVRDPAQKKIAHNVTILNPVVGRSWTGGFLSQWKSGRPFTPDVIDEMLAS
jgi:hypothetical protein